MYQIAIVRFLVGHWRPSKPTTLVTRRTCTCRWPRLGFLVGSDVFHFFRWESCREMSVLTNFSDTKGEIKVGFEANVHKLASSEKIILNLLSRWRRNVASQETLQKTRYLGSNYQVDLGIIYNLQWHTDLVSKDKHA